MHAQMNSRQLRKSKLINSVSDPGTSVCEQTTNQIRVDKVYYFWVLVEKFTDLAKFLDMVGFT